MTGESGFTAWQGQRFICSSTVAKLDLLPTQLPGTGYALIIGFRRLLRLRMRGSASTTSHIFI